MNFDFKFEETFGEYIFIFLNLGGKFCLKNRLIVWIVKKKLKVKEEKLKSKKIKLIKKSKIKSKIIKCIKNFKKSKIHFFNKDKI